MNNGRVSDDDGVRRYVRIHIGSGCDQDVIADGDSADDDGVGADPDMVSYGGNAFPASAVALTDRDTGREVDISSKGDIRMEDDPSEMTEVETGTGIDLGRDIDVRLVGELHQFYSIEQGEESAARLFF